MIQPTSPEIGGMGHSVKRKEDARFIQGKGNYVDDVHLPGMVFGHVVRSPYGHARLKSINIDEAMKVPGALAVITGADLAAAGLAWMPTLFHDKQMVLATGKVLFQAQEVAFCVATGQYAAADMAELVEVEYEELPVLVDPHKALDPDAPILREDREEKSNHIFHWEVGDRPATQKAIQARSGHRQSGCGVPTLPSGAARNLRLRGRFQPGDLEADHLVDLPGAACASHAVCAGGRHSRTEHPRDLARYRRRIRQQGSHLSRLRLRGGRVVEARDVR